MKEKKHPNIKKIKIKYVVVCINPKYVNKLTFFLYMKHVIRKMHGTGIYVNIPWLMHKLNLGLGMRLC